MSRPALSALLSVAGLFLLATSGAASATTVTCESKGGATQSCPVDASGGVRLVHQLSSQGCWENDTWGHDQSRIWVSNGCRAEFEVGQQGAKSSGSGGALAAAAIVGIAAAAVIANNHDDHDKHHKNQNYNSGNRYGYNDNYDYDYDDNRYRNYDRGRNYENSRYGYNGYGGDPRRNFTCESHNGQTSNCTLPVRGHVEIYRQLSSKSCTYGRSWGVQGNHVWVQDGCRAEFAVY